MSIRLLALLLSALFVIAPAAAQGGKRVALVIANAAYSNVPRLTNPPADAALVAASLRRAGFTSVTTLRDADKAALENALQRFGTEAEGADVAMVYYAGHGIEVAGRNFLIPVSARLIRDRDADVEAVALDTVLRQVEGAKLRLVVLDACRENPFAASMARAGQGRSIGRGLGRVEPDGDTLVVYAAKAGAIAADGDGANSPFARALSTRIVEPGLEISLLFRRVRDDVLTATRRQQEPFTYGSLSGSEFYFVPAGGAAVKPAVSTAYRPTTTLPTSGATASWRKITARDLDVMPTMKLAKDYNLVSEVDDIRAAAASGDAAAAALLASLLSTKALGEEDYAESARWAKRAAEAGNASGMVVYGDLYLNGNGGLPKDYAKALTLFQNAAKKGNVSATVYIGHLNYFGQGVPKDQPAAFKLFRQAADLGLNAAVGTVAEMYFSGIGVTKDRAQALSWARRGAELEDARSLHIVGWLYHLGEGGLPRDHTQAAQWTRRAADAGDPEAMQSLGRYYEEGTGVQQDYAQAMGWYRRAFDADHAAAAVSIGLLYRDGKSVTQDYAEAIRWFRRAADRNIGNGMNALGYMYSQGLGVTKDLAQAFEWHRRGADAGNPSAIYNLAWMYENGAGVAVDRERAIAGYKKAAALNFQAAIDALKRLGVAP